MKRSGTRSGTSLVDTVGRACSVSIEGDGESAQEQSFGRFLQSSITGDEDHRIPHCATLGDHSWQGGDQWVYRGVSCHRHPHRTPTIGQP